MKLLILQLIVLFYVCSAKIYSKCEFAKIAKQNGLGMLGTWTCIVARESKLNTETKSYDGDYGIFQISKNYWCGSGKPCGISCDLLLNDDLSDDISCAKRIFQDATHKGKDGFSPWSSTYQYCQGDQKQWVENCNV